MQFAFWQFWLMPSKDVIKRLAARLGITEDGEDESSEESDDADSSDEIRVDLFDGKKKGGAA